MLQLLFQPSAHTNGVRTDLHFGGNKPHQISMARRQSPGVGVAPLGAFLVLEHSKGGQKTHSMKLNSALVYEIDNKTDNLHTCFPACRKLQWGYWMTGCFRTCGHNYGNIRMHEK